jgi:tRNA A37 threonylcarbamoyladenosine biosynthesis protein TsaE
MRILELLFLPGDGGAVMLAGPTGSGKSLLVQAFLNGCHRWLGDAKATPTFGVLPDKEKAGE